MAGPQNVYFGFPLKGVNAGVAPADQPKGTAASLSNVRPFDTTKGQASGGRRPGTAKVLQSALAGPIRTVQQTTLPGVNQTIVGYLLGAAGALSPASPLWAAPVTQHTSFDDEFSAATWRGSIGAVGDPTGLSATHNKLGFQGFLPDGDFGAPTSSGAAGAYRAECYSNAALVFSTRWRVEVLIYQLPFASTIDAAATDVCLLTRVDRTDFSAIANVVSVRVHATGAHAFTIELRKGASTVLATATLHANPDPGTLDSFIIAAEYDGAGKMDVYGRFVTTAAGVDPSIKGTHYFRGVDVGTTGPTNANMTFGVSMKRWTADIHEAPTIQNAAVVSQVQSLRQRDVRLYAAAGGNIYSGEITGLAIAGAAALDDSAQVNACDSDAKAFFVDGTNTKVLDIASGNVTDLVATDGKGDAPEKCKVCCVWRGRLVLANQDNFEQNVYMSRAGDPLDWLYGTNDQGSAVALNAATLGHIGQPVFCLIPFRDDVLLIGCDHSLYALVGDPAAGGSLVTVSDSIGILGPNAWVQSPEGLIYFVGTGGFYRMSTHGDPPENLSQGPLNEFFRDIDRGAAAVSLVWDRDGHGCWIFVAPIGGEGTGFGAALWFDARTGGFFPATFPDAQQPLCLSIYDGDAPEDRYMLMGCADGILRRLDDQAADDDGTPIVSSTLIGPVTPGGPYNAAMLMGWEVVWGSTPASDATIYVLAGNSAEEALAAATQTLAVYAAASGRQQRLHSRYRGNTFYVRVDSVGYWNLSRLGATVAPGGPMR